MRHPLPPPPGREALRACVLLFVFVLAGCRTGLRPTPNTRGTDLDGDGRIDRIQTLDQAGRVVGVVDAPEPGSDPDRTVAIAIDAVPYEIFAKVQREGLFNEFFPAARMIAPYPSLTNIGYTAILRTPPVLGYEDRYFDPVENRMRGGVGDRLFNRFKNVAPFHDVFAWEPPHLWGVGIYYFPGTITKAELHKIEEILHTSEEKELVLYFGGTDALGHVRGWGGLEEYLHLVDRMLRGFLAAGGGSRRVVLFSDHGTSAVPSRRVDLETALKEAGFRLRKRIDDPGDVVVPGYGLVGSIQAFTSRGEEEAVARAVLGAEGVDFVFWRDGDGVAALSADGRPDPLGRPEAEYPDLRRRVEEAARNHTAHPASVFASLHDGWHYGSKLFEFLANMKGTHGSARATSTLGFVVSNVDRLPDALRAEEVYPWLGLSREPEPRRP
ncbi:MAG: alkaline phosphatase family protein [Acidobacteria bacterium]|nr:alkaline phosphatase family protein [Acidobacteriota bacterium]